jgi:L-seryl-tRNA(Ser) seleniumtransferase
MSLRDLPSVDRLIGSKAGTTLASTYGRALAVQAIRESLDEARAAIQEGQPAPDNGALIEHARISLDGWLAPTLLPVINATGVIIHTNAAKQAMLTSGSSYNTLEYNLVRGTRGKRERHTESLLQRLTGAEAALVVNNNAAAVLLALTALAKRKEVLVSRSQLIEIGGGFRVPDVMRQSGAKLKEVGTTNRTHLRDFEDAIHDRTGLIMRAHHSNFKIVGFTTEPALTDLVALGERNGIPVLDDLGSGAVLDTTKFGLGHEPMVQESLQAGASLVAFSGDKLLGGPQAGILVGKKELIARLRKHPLARAVRSDKLCLAALGATLLHYLKGEATQKIPVWQMISASEEDLQKRSETWAAYLQAGRVIPGRSTVGGGSLPEETLPTQLLALDVKHPNALASRLRKATPPLITRIESDQVLLDPRTVLDDQEEMLLEVLKNTLAEIR